MWFCARVKTNTTQKMDAAILKITIFVRTLGLGKTRLIGQLVVNSEQLVVHLRSMLFVGSSQPGSVQPQVNLTFHDDHSWLAIQSDLGWDHPSDSLKSKDRLPHEHRQELGIYTIVERGVLIWCNYLYLVSQPETIREDNLEPKNHSPPGWHVGDRFIIVQKSCSSLWKLLQTMGQAHIYIYILVNQGKRIVEWLVFMGDCVFFFSKDHVIHCNTFIHFLFNVFLAASKDKHGW